MWGKHEIVIKIMFLFVIGMIVEACESPNPKAISLSRAEAKLDRDSAQAMALYANMPEIYFNEENFFCLHREECLVSMYLHKAKVELKKGNIKALEPIAQNIIIGIIVFFVETYTL